MTYSQRPSTPWGGRAYLLFDMFRGLREVNTLPARVPLGTYLRSGGSWQIYTIKAHSNVREREWRSVPVTDIPARLKTEMLLLGVA